MNDALHAIDAYIEAWNEPLVDKRGQILARAMADASTYTDPNTRLDTREGLADYIGEVLGRQPGRRIVRTSEVDSHHLVCRFNWRLIKADGTRGAESVDFIEFAPDGRIQHVTGFFGPLKPADGG
ncbi:MAG TPA: nuclear transport factor 2 family protein [Candidatus Limnocylindrales bacterium]